MRYALKLVKLSNTAILCARYGPNIRDGVDFPCRSTPVVASAGVRVLSVALMMLVPEHPSGELRTPTFDQVAKAHVRPVLTESESCAEPWAGTREHTPTAAPINMPNARWRLTIIPPGGGSTYAMACIYPKRGSVRSRVADVVEGV